MITFFTNCYEADWVELIINGGIQRKIDNCKCEFSQKVLIINNVNDKKVVKIAANELIENNIIDNYYFADELSELVLNYFDIKIDSFNGLGYWCSIAPLIAVYVCTTKYMVYFTGDAICENSKYDWIGDGIKMLQTYNDVKVINPVWNNAYEQALNEENFYINQFEVNFKYLDWHWGYSFSDQCFLIETKTFCSKIYNEKDDMYAFYPRYAGNSFENRISAYFKKNKYIRLTSKNCSYKHPFI